MWFKFRTERRTLKLLQFLQLPSVGKVLDLSCGEGGLLGKIQAKHPELDLYGVDISTSALAKARGSYPGINFQEAKVQALPFDDAAFDIITCAMSWHHYAAPQQVFGEISRTLRSDGAYYLMDVVPKNKLSLQYYNRRGCSEPYHFEGFYTLQQLEIFAQKASLRLVRKRSINKFLRIEAIEFRKFHDS